MMLNRHPMPPPMRGAFRGGPRGKLSRFPPPNNDFRGVNRKGKIFKKNRIGEADLAKPFVTAAIKAEFEKKEEFYFKAKTTQKKDDWDIYCTQRDLCRNMFSEAEKEFAGQQEVRIPQLMPPGNFTRVTAPIDYTADVIL